MIATWRLDLNKILCVFDVGSITSVWPPPTVFFQAELATTTHPVVSNIGRDAVNTQVTAPEHQRDAPNNYTILSNIQRAVLKEVASQKQSVSAASASFDH